MTIPIETFVLGLIGVVVTFASFMLRSWMQRVDRHIEKSADFIAACRALTDRLEAHDEKITRLTSSVDKLWITLEHSQIIKKRFSDKLTSNDAG